MKDNQQPSSVKFKELPKNTDYLIYEDGRVYSKKTNRFLTGKIDSAGYKVYSLAIGDAMRSCSNKKLSKTMYAHRLVAMLFIDNPNNYPYVVHKDKNKLNNHVSNLEWVQNITYHNKKTHNKLKNLPGEEWLIIPEQPNYSVSNMGRIRNNNTNRLLKIDENSKYSRISFADKKQYFLHRLVYCVFNNDYDLDNFVINHIDKNPRNNKLENLQKIKKII